VVDTRKTQKLKEEMMKKVIILALAGLLVGLMASVALAQCDEGTFTIQVVPAGICPGDGMPTAYAAEVIVSNAADAPALYNLKVQGGTSAGTIWVQDDGDAENDASCLV